MSRPRIVAIVALPPPVTGQSVVSARAVEALREVADVDAVDVSAGGGGWRAGRGAQARAWAGALAAVRRALRRPADAVYLTPASSRLGVLRDAATLALVPRGVPVVAHVHVGDYGARLAGSALARRVAARFDRLLVPSEYAARPIQRAAPRADVRVIPNAVDPGHLQDDDALDAAWARRRAAAPVVTFLSNMIPSKGYGVLADAVARLDPRPRLVVAGSWPQADARRAYERYLATLGLEARVVGDVARADVPALLAEASVFAFPSRYPHESLPVAVIEAMAAGCAVAAVEHAGVPELARDGAEAALAPRLDDDDAQARAFAEALRRALADAERLGRAAAARAQAFSPDAFDAALREAVMELACGSPPRP